MSTTDQLRTYQEMNVEEAFVQYLEEFRSGTPGSGDGLNRPLAQLARNADALLDVLQASRSQVLTGGGTISWDATTGTLQWTSTLAFRFAHELSGADNNTLTAGTAVLNAPGKLAYVKFDRTANGAALAVTVVPSLAAFIVAITGQDDRLDYQVLAYRDGVNVILGDGRRVRSGFALSSQGYIDTQYGQQAELTLVHDNEKENFKLLLTAGGSIYWDATEVSGVVGRIHWTEPLVVKLPATDGEISITGDGAPGDYYKNLADGDVLWITLARKLAGSVSVAVNRSVAGAAPLAGDDVFVLATREGDRVYFWDGTALSDGDTVLLGGVRSGVQWFHATAGNDDQVTDFGSTRNYRVGTGELMVYRNGVKARASAAYWSGTFPGGALVGTLEDDAQYAEEDTNGDGTGYRVIWIADDGTPFLSHPPTTHAPGDPFTWPSTDDWLEAFVGVMGDGPSPVESIGIEGEVDALEGDVKVRGEGGISTSYDGNTIVFTLDAGAGVTSLNGLGAAVTLDEGRLVSISVAGSTITISLDATDDQADAIAGMLGNMEADEDASASNPLVARRWVLDGLPPLVGFDVYAGSGTSIQVGSGRLRLGNTVRVQAAAIEVTTADVIASDTITAGAWHYLYVGAPRDGSEEVGGYLSTTPPGVDGRHPDSDTLPEGELWFVSSVYFYTISAHVSFTKRAGRVVIREPLVTLPTPSMTGSYETIDVSSALPDTAVTSIGVEFTATQADPVAVDPYISVRPGGSVTSRQYYVPAVNGGKGTHVLEVPIDPVARSFDVLFRSSAWASLGTPTVAWYDEGTHSAGSGLWS